MRESPGNHRTPRPRQQRQALAVNNAARSSSVFFRRHPKWRTHTKPSTPKAAKRANPLRTGPRSPANQANRVSRHARKIAPSARVPAGAPLSPERIEPRRSTLLGADSTMVLPAGSRIAQESWSSLLDCLMALEMPHCASQTSSCLVHHSLVVHRHAVRRPRGVGLRKKRGC